MFNLRLILKNVATTQTNKILSFKYISTTAASFRPRHPKNELEKEQNTDVSAKSAMTSAPQKNPFAEEEIWQEIEDNLFSHSSTKHNPPKQGVQAILNKYKTKKVYIKKEEVKHKPEPIPVVKKKEYPTTRVIEDKELGITYTRLELNHPLLSTLLMKVRSKKHRDKNNLILIEGRRLFLEAMDCGLNLENIVFSQKEQIALIDKKYLNRISKIGGIYKVPQHDLKIWSSLTTPPGVIGIFTRPTTEEISNRLEKYSEITPPLPITVVCDNIREPSNLGNIIRTSAAIPCTEVIVLKGCCDPWESKALRGGCGGQFRVPIRDDVNWETYINEELSEHADSNILISENNWYNIKEYGFEEKTEIYSDINVDRETNKYIVIIGGETHGVSEDVYSSLATCNVNAKCIHIPLASGVESLNATTALSLLLFEIRRKLFLNQTLVARNQRIEDDVKL